MYNVTLRVSLFLNLSVPALPVMRVATPWPVFYDLFLVNWRKLPSATKGRRRDSAFDRQTRGCSVCRLDFSF